MTQQPSLGSGNNAALLASATTDVVQAAQNPAVWAWLEKYVAPVFGKRWEVAFTAGAVLISQVAGVHGDISHLSANEITGVAAAVFTFGEALKDGINGNKT